MKVDESRKEVSSLLGGSVGCLSEGPNTSTPGQFLQELCRAIKYLLNTNVCCGVKLMSWRGTAVTGLHPFTVRRLQTYSCLRSQAGLCRDSSPSLPEETAADSRLGILEPDENTEEGARKRLSGHFNLETLVNAEDIHHDSDITEDFKAEVQETKPVAATSHIAVAGDEVLPVQASLDAKSEAKNLLGMKEACGDGFLPPSSPFPSSLAKVAQYLEVQMPVEVTTPPALEDAAEIMEDAADISIASSHSHSVASRQSDLSSLSGARMRGLFHGTALAANNSPVCPFPEEWQYNIIPEVIENEEDID